MLGADGENAFRLRLACGLRRFAYPQPEQFHSEIAQALPAGKAPIADNTSKNGAGGENMARMRAGKTQMKELLESEDWLERLQNSDLPLKARMGPLLSFLPAGGTLAGRAAVALGRSAAELARVKPEEARVLLRRFMWHMNEESGNLGWGIPESMAEACVHSDLLAGEFAHILVSYIRRTGREDNFVDHAPLRLSCYRAVGRLLGARRELRDRTVPFLIAGLEDTDIACRAMAAWALLQAGAPDAALPTLLRMSGNEREAGMIVQVFDGHAAQECTAVDLARTASVFSTLSQ